MEMRRVVTSVLLMVTALVCQASDIFLDFDCTSQSPMEKGITLAPNRLTVKQDGKTCTFEHTCKALYIAKGFTGLQLGATDSDLRNGPYLFLTTPLKGISFIEITVRAKFPGGWLEAGSTSDDSPMTDFRLSGTNKLRTNMAEQYETYRFVPADGHPASGNAMIRVTSTVSGFFVRIQSIRIHCKD